MGLSPGELQAPISPSQSLSHPYLKGKVPLQAGMATTQGANKVEKKSKILLKLTVCELVLDREKNTQEADDFPATDDHHQGNGVSC